MKNKKHMTLVLIRQKLILIVIIIFVFSFYYSKYESLLTNIFKTNSPSTKTYVRATVLTYWIDTNYCTDDNDLKTCQIYGRSSWNLKNGVINSNWTANEDGYYYYNQQVDVNENNIVDLINPNLTINELTDDYLLGTNIVPQYEVLYEYIEQK